MAEAKAAISVEQGGQESPYQAARSRLKYLLKTKAEPDKADYLADLQAAFQDCETAAYEGDFDAQWFCGEVYRKELLAPDGTKIVEQNLRASLSWYLLAGRQGYGKAYYMAGFIRPKNTEEQLRKAINCFNNARKARNSYKSPLVSLELFLALKKLHEIIPEDEIREDDVASLKKHMLIALKAGLIAITSKGIIIKSTRIFFEFAAPKAAAEKLEKNEDKERTVKRRVFKKDDGEVPPTPHNSPVLRASSALIMRSLSSGPTPLRLGGVAEGEVGENPQFAVREAQPASLHSGPPVDFLAVELDSSERLVL